MKKLLAALLVIAVFVSAIGLSLAEGEKQIPIKSVKIKEQKIKLPVDESLTLTVMIKPNGASNTELEWISSDESVCTVENGTIKAIGAGKCNIECKTKDGSKKKPKVAVTVFVPDPPILFRDIPWGSDMATSIEAGDFANCAFYFENPTPYNSWYTVDALNGLVHCGDCQTGYEVMILNSDIERQGDVSFVLLQDVVTVYSVQV